MILYLDPDVSWSRLWLGRLFQQWVDPICDLAICFNHGLIQIMTWRLVSTMRWSRLWLGNLFHQITTCGKAKTTIGKKERISGEKIRLSERLGNPIRLIDRCYRERKDNSWAWVRHASRTFVDVDLFVQFPARRTVRDLLTGNCSFALFNCRFELIVFINYTQ